MLFFKENIKPLKWKKCIYILKNMLKIKFGIGMQTVIVTGSEWVGKPDGEYVTLSVL